MKLTRAQKAHKEQVELIDRTLRAVALPRKPRVVEIRYRLRTGFEGDDVVSVWLILADEDAPRTKADFAAIRPMKEQVREALLEIDIPDWPLVGIRTESEQRELESEEYAPTGIVHLS